MGKSIKYSKEFKLSAVKLTTELGGIDNTPPHPPAPCPLSNQVLY
ncbi:hypothetical protein DSM19430T_08950 [Desulfovibrio psychrotolerans]|uniref:Transposase n=1 Tax=Desulfovibrio psychrotolerans TaxID=415242 RepID=A0A7J0BSP1_9BACT|nr:hypothetical protein DSM19430T_08950 [Desulfovibrio psychrotolerans]